MARKLRIFYKNAIHHVLFRGNQKQQIFSSSKDYKKYLQLMEDLTSEEECHIHAYTLMPNHGHLITQQASDNPLSNFMHRLQTSYSSFWNKKYNKVGHVFQGRFKAILCLKESYLLELIRYIHLNSVVAGLVKNPEEYIWSSHKDYVDLARETFIERDLILSLFNGNNDQLLRFINDGMTKESTQFNEISLAIERAISKSANHPIPILSDVFKSEYKNADVKIHKSDKILAKFIKSAQRHGYSVNDIVRYLGCSKSTLMRKKS